MEIPFCAAQRRASVPFSGRAEADTGLCICALLYFQIIIGSGF